MISMKKLRFSSHPSQGKSLAHGANGNCHSIALVFAASLPSPPPPPKKKSAKGYLTGLHKFGVVQTFTALFDVFQSSEVACQQAFHVACK